VTRKAGKSLPGQVRSLQEHSTVKISCVYCIIGLCFSDCAFSLSLKQSQDATGLK